MQLEFYGDAPCERKPKRVKSHKSKKRTTKRKCVLPANWKPPQSGRTGWLPRFLAHFTNAAECNAWSAPIGDDGPMLPPALWLEALS